MKPRKVLVVGGGSSGWMTAAYLNAALNRNGKKLADITLVESPDVPRVGVGEATILSIHHILSVIGVDIVDFMKSTDATFKQSIKYTNWLHNKGESYHHSFQRFRDSPIDTTGRDWYMSDRSVPIMETVSIQPKSCDMNLSPQMLGPGILEHPLNTPSELDFDSNKWN
jgi:tryptophan halogenase